ncbi:MAG: TetR/AcrR family transcriptional regulator [Oscillospiraceae bacterium]|nr:TetR/AcrR family transcriptional regulator [Oscillospiraceae bacterium]
MSIRDEQREQRRQLIFDKAIELFAKRGYANTKIGDIAKAADMSVGLMFHYFESKEKLFEELVRYGVQAADNTPREMNFENPLDYFEGFLKMLFHYAKEQPQIMYMFVIMGQLQRGEGIPEHILEIARGADQISQSAEIIEAGQQYGYFREGDPYLLSFTFWSSVQGVMEQLAVHPEMLESDTLPETDWLIGILSKERKQ